MRHLLTSLILVTCLIAAVSCQTSDSGSESGSEASVTTATETAATETAATETAATETAAAERLTATGSALTTIFSPARAPKRKTMGLLQRSFLDLADQGDQELQLAIVVDGTDSMAATLADVRQSIHRMLEDLRRVRKNEVRVAIVVYRDAGSLTGEVEIPLGEFSNDEATIAEAVESLQPKSGAPYFHELPDLGLQHAMDKLPWSDDDRVTKWILLFGDAPPYSESIDSSKVPEARRRVSTANLISTARRKNIRINCLLCTSSDNVSKAYEEAKGETRSFMNALAGGTDGLMLDLSYEAIRTAMIDAAKQPEVGLTAIDPITGIDLAAVRREKVAGDGAIKQVSLAVVPHMPLNKISFDARLPAVQVSTALRTQLAQIPGVRVASPRDIKEQLRRLDSDGISGANAMRGLAARLGVDFVVWGSLVSEATVQTAAYRRDDGGQIVPIKLAKNSNDIAYALINASSSGAENNAALAQLVKNMGQVQTQMQAPIAKSPATTDDLLTAFEALEQSLAFEAGSDESVALLETADQATKNAIRAEDDNAIAHWLQANVAYNQASRLYRSGELEAGMLRMRDVRSSLSDALEHRENVANKSLVTEIEGDYYLNEKKFKEAIGRYEKLTDSDQPLKSQLRGHWMLAGIYAGDWGNAEKETVDPVKARSHITEILANWPESPEAKLLKLWLRWDDSKDETSFNYLPQLNTGLL